MADEMERTEDYSEQDRARRSEDSTRGVVALGSLDDFEVAEDFPDPRGWDVMLTDGQRIGEVRELMVDTNALRTRYLEVSLDQDAANVPDSRNVLIPVGSARLDDDKDQVVLDGIDAARLASLPAFDQSQFNQDYEQSVVSSFGTEPTAGATTGNEDFYRNESFNDERFYGSRFRAAGRQDLQDEDARVARSEEQLAIGKRRGMTKDSTGEAIAGGAGGVAGATGGAAIGSVAGPIGTVVGAVAGALGGWWAGRNVAETVSDFDSDDEYYRSRFSSSTTGKKDFTYDRARPVYQLGYLASRNPDYQGRRFDDIEPELKRGWTQDLSRDYGDWDNVRGYAAEAFDRGGERITGSDEERAIGNRPVQTGEVELLRTVETEHRSESIGDARGSQNPATSGRIHTDEEDQTSRR
ncbi:MAG TPA: PRC-barrel domain-containing protein [Gemmatimonadaceae bacterium]|nr:PRC-barrel domain-containing protein [Gemmatimonadaceae bacterium]